MTFDSFGLAEALTRAVRESGYLTPTPIQIQAIPMVLSGHDLLAAAQTGTGKTAAFTLPLLHRLLAAPAPRDARGRPLPRVLVLAPTRELAAQVAESVRTYGAHTSLRALPVFGGVGMQPQIDALARGVDIVVATPGRLLDHLGRRSLDLSAIEVLVLDEADRMLDMGFAPDVERILQQTPKQRQTLLFSATVPAWIHRLAERHMREPETLSVAGEMELVPTVRQWCIECSWAEKEEALTMLLDSPQVRTGLIFTATKRNADHLHAALLARGYDVTVIHGDLSQHDRDLALERFRNSKVRFLIATDVAARGLDIEDISHVINYDAPSSPEDYVHRVGRTARAGREGVALTLITPIEILKIRDIERHTHRAIERHQLSDLRLLAGSVGELVS